MTTWMNRALTGLILLGLILTLVSYFRLCSEACGQVHNYKFFGYSFELLGFLFYGTLLLVQLLIRESFWKSLFISLSFFMALGAEINFVLMQHYVIEAYCPVCLSIAATVFLTCWLLVIRFLYNVIYLDSSPKGEKMLKAIGKMSTGIFVCVIGFVISFAGVFKPEKSFADGLKDNEVPYFGNSDSVVEVFIITDWFCPACKEKEPILDPLYAKIMKDARLYFIDYPIHSESMNFMPYNLSFMLKDKDNYFKLRKALSRLAKKTKTPSDSDVAKAIDLYGAKYQPLSFADINEGVKFMEGVIKTFKVKVTPTVVVANRKELNAKKLTGSDISQENIFKAIDEMKSQKR